MDLKEARQNQAVERHPWERARLEVVTALVRQYASADAAAGAILDVGCGDTWLVEQLARRLPLRRYYAVDPGFEPSELLAARQRLGPSPIRVFRELEDVPASSPAADLVLLLDVLEHVPDEVAFLKQLDAGPHVGPDTRLIITVPAWQELFCSHDVFLGHHRRYTSQLLRERLADSGFRIEESGYFFSSLMLARMVQLLYEKAARIDAATARGVGRTRSLPLVDGAVSAALVLDYRLCRLLTRMGMRLPGLSLFAVARRA